MLQADSREGSWVDSLRACMRPACALALRSTHHTATSVAAALCTDAPLPLCTGTPLRRIRKPTILPLRTPHTLQAVAPVKSIQAAVHGRSSTMTPTVSGVVRVLPVSLQDGVRLQQGAPGTDAE